MASTPTGASQLEQFIAEPMGEGLAEGAPVELREQRSFSPDTRGEPGEPPPAPHQDTGDHDGDDEGPDGEPGKVAPGEKLGSEIAKAGVDLSDPELRDPTIAGGIGGAGLGASLGRDDPPPGSVVRSAAPDGADNEQADARLAQARAQGGEPGEAGLDETRAEGRTGSINDQDGD